ncbi:hypothetical protein FB451DRAFT_454329 [Mycena latifolia]|nr:hypothetical protein FB451DRAFT_454329 [Mycena latifolia]
MVDHLNDARLAPTEQLDAFPAEIAPREMHRSLRIPEIAQMIVSHIDPTSDVGARPDLASLARTCRLFHDHALDVLWKRQDTIANLVGCMPADLWTIQNVNERRRSMHLRRPIVASDWERLLHYSHRVKSLSLQPSYSDDAMYEVYAVMQRTSIPSDFLLPNLEILQWTDYSRIIAIAHIHLFLGPRITSVYFGHGLSSAERSILPTLTRRFPMLTDVNIKPDLYSRAEGQASISAFICGLQNVKFLSTANLDLPALAHLGRLPALETLNLAGICPTTFSSLYNLDLFRYLRWVDLSFRRGNMESATGFVRAWSNAPLCGFKATLPTCPTAEVMADLYHALAEHCTPKSLETLEVAIAYGQADNAHIIPGDVLKLLSCFTNLVEVTIEATIGYHLDDATIDELARAWPHLEDLRLKAEWHDHSPSVTLLSLRTLARHCPHIHTLEMTFDASSVPESPRELHLREQLLHPTLTTLNVAHSPITVAFDVARYISAMFSNLTDIETVKEDWTPDEEEDTEQDRAEIRYNELWKQVESFLPGLNDIRAEEYHWGGQSIGLAEYLPLEFKSG